MSKKIDVWTETVEQLIDAFGGVENIKDALHCATRFRVVVFNDEKVDKEKLKSLKKAKGVNKEIDQWQVIFGAGVVNKVFENYQKYIKSLTNLDSSTIIKNTNLDIDKISWWNNDLGFGSNIWMDLRRLLREFAAIFVPLIPIFIAAGLSLAFSSLMISINGGSIPTTGLEFAFWKLFDTIGGAILGSLPVFAAWSLMKRLGGPQVYGIGVGLVLVAPGLLNAWETTTPIQIGLIPGQDLYSYAFEQGYLVGGDLENIYNSSGEIIISVGQEIIYSLNENDYSYIIQAKDINENVAIALNSGWSIEQIVGLSHENFNDGITLDLSTAASSLIGTYTIIFSEGAGGFFQIKLIGYQAQVFSALLATLLFFSLYKFLTKITPESLVIIVVPFVTFFVGTWLTLWIVGPIGRGISNGIAWLFNIIFFNTNFAWFGLGGFIIAFFYPMLIVTGLHQGLTPIEATIIAETAATYGESFSYITAVGSCTNVGIGAAIFGYAFISKSKPDKSLGASSGITANFGITEPALFGANLELGYPMIASMIGGGIGGYFCGATGIYASSMGSASWLGLIQFNPIATDAYKQFLVDKDISAALKDVSPMLKEAIALALTFISSFVLTIVFANTKWGQSKNRQRGVETLTWKEMHYVFSPSKTFKKEEIEKINLNKYAKKIEKNSEKKGKYKELIKEKSILIEDIYNLKNNLKNSNKDQTIKNKIIELEDKINAIKLDIKAINKKDDNVKISNFKDEINILKKEIKKLKHQYKESMGISDNERNRIKNEIFKKEVTLSKIKHELKIL